MKHVVKFYPVGNGDTSQIILSNGKRILFDFCHRNNSEDRENPKIDLASALRKELEGEKRNYFDVVAFTHADEDHIVGSSGFFYLEHAAKYQDDERIKISELWVPAAMILDDGESEEARILRQEARYRLKQGKGIRVFSKPNKLEKWLQDNDLQLSDREHLITDAGNLVDGFSLQSDGVEFFCHSPFIKHVDEEEELRNRAALIFQVRFEIDNQQINYIAIGDSEYEVLEDIVEISQYHKNDDRLDWDLFNIPHHCSYKALASDKGEHTTTPTTKVQELLLHGQSGAFQVSSSLPIKVTKEAHDQEQPPHIQAKRAYERYLTRVDGTKLFVTMETPNEKKPEPIEFEITGKGISRRSTSVSGAAAIITSAAPRAGSHR